MKLITNRISTGKGISFEDLIKKIKDERQVKTAAIGKTVKIAEEKDEADSSGQLAVEPLHQKGESTTMPKNGPSAKKEGEDTVSEGKVAEEKDEADSSGQPEAEGTEKFTNDPKVPCKEEKDGSVEVEIKEADGTCEKCNKGCDECICEKCECKACKAFKEVEVKEAGIKGNCSKCGKPNFLCKGKCDGSSDDKKDEDGESKIKEDNKEEKEASKKTEFVKIANLDGKNKSFLKEYWRQLYDDEYVEALIVDK